MSFAFIASSAPSILRIDLRLSLRVRFEDVDVDRGIVPGGNVVGADGLKWRSTSWMSVLHQQKRIWLTFAHLLPNLPSSFSRSSAIRFRSE